MSEENKEEKSDKGVRDLPAQKDVKGGGGASEKVGGPDPLTSPPDPRKITEPKIVQ